MGQQIAGGGAVAEGLGISGFDEDLAGAAEQRLGSAQHGEF